MVILDTSIWIEFFKGNDPYFDQVSFLIDQNEVIGLSYVFGELLQGAKGNRENNLIHDFWSAIPKISETELFIRAGLESCRKKWLGKGVGIIDAAIIVAARESSSFVWTLDKKLSRLLTKEEKYFS